MGCACDRLWDAQEGCGVVVSGFAVTGAGTAVPAHPSLLTAEKSL
jgi:hypothetical protein